jgi:hypothetical protein
VLAFLGENAMASVPGGSEGGGGSAINDALALAFATVYPTLVNTVVQAGYFAPVIVAQVDQDHRLNIPDPTQPLLSSDGSGQVLSAPLTQSADGEWVFDAESAGGKQWLYESKVNDLAAVTVVGSTINADTRFVVSLP